MAGLIEKGIDEHSDQLFAVGVDPDLPKNLEIASIWPTVQEVREYRNTIYNVVHEVLDRIDLSKPISQESPLWAIMMTLEHDRIHFETSSVLIRQLDVELVQRPESWKYAPTLGNPPKNQWIAMNGGEIQIGKPSNSDTFGWDNEFGTLSPTAVSYTHLTLPTICSV